MKPLNFQLIDAGCEAVNEETTRTAGAAILRYSQRMQNILGSAVKAEPWMHICFIKYKEQGSEEVKICYGIYIWDTRQVLESKDTTVAKYDECMSGNYSYAADNHKDLRGSSDIAKLFRLMMQKVYFPKQYKPRWKRS